MTNFTITQLAASVGAYTGWATGKPSVTRNRLGTFYAVEDAPAEVTDGYPNSFHIYRDSGAGPVSVYSTGSINSNGISLESLSTGELYMTYADWINSYVYVVYWADISVSTTPTTTLQMTAAGANTKFGTIIDEQRRCLFIMGDIGTIFRVSDVAVELGRKTLFTAVTDSPNYCQLLLDNGILYVLLMNALGGSPAPQYDCITALSSPNPYDIGTASNIWTTYDWVGGNPSLTLPVDPGFNGPLNFLTTGEQYRGFSNYLCGAAIRNKVLRYAVAERPGPNQRFWTYDDLRDSSIQMSTVRWDNISTSGNLFRGRHHKPLRDGLIIPRSVSGAVNLRMPGDFFITHDRTSIIAMKSSDQGSTYQVFAQTQVPGLGTDTIHYVNTFRGGYTDTDIIGMFTVEHCTPSQWSTSTIPAPPGYAANNPTATAYYFSLPVA